MRRATMDTVVTHIEEPETLNYHRMIRWTLQQDVLAFAIYTLLAFSQTDNDNQWDQNDTRRGKTNSDCCCIDWNELLATAMLLTCHFKCLICYPLRSCVSLYVCVCVLDKSNYNNDQKCEINDNDVQPHLFYFCFSRWRSLFAILNSLFSIICTVYTHNWLVREAIGNLFIVIQTSFGF